MPTDDDTMWVRAGALAGRKRVMPIVLAIPWLIYDGQYFGVPHQWLLTFADVLDDLADPDYCLAGDARWLHRTAERARKVDDYAY